MIAALAIGFLGSLHCLGMCGPLMITFVGPRRSLFSVVGYHSGRLLSYGILGSLLGLVGESVALFSLQKYVTLLLGVFLILLYGIPSIRVAIEKWYFHSSFSRFIRGRLSKNLSMGKRWFLSGVANGFLPCGLTYVAAAGAVALGSYWYGFFFMILFGVGTVPALISLQLGSAFAFKGLKRLIPRATAVIAIISGSILVLRGALMTFPGFNQMVRANAISLMTVCGL